MNIEVAYNDTYQILNVTDICKELVDNPFTDQELADVELYYKSLLKVGLVKIISNGHIYDISKYNYFITIVHNSNVMYKLIMRRTMADLVYQYRIIEFLIHEKLFGCKSNDTSKPTTKSETNTRAST